MKVKNRPDNWDAMKDYVMVNSTLDDPTRVVSSLQGDQLRAVKTASYLGTVTNGPATFAKGVFPLKDAAGRQVGVVLALSDVTDQIHSQRSSLLLLILISVAIFVISFIVALRYLRVEIIDPLVSLAEQANDISMGNVEKKLETKREDEIGLLIHAFERMRVSLKKSLALLAKRS